MKYKMVDYFLCSVFFSQVVVTLGDVCFYEDGSRYGRTILCTGTCCGTGEDPCCVDTGSIIAITVGGVISFVLLLICVIVCCAQRAHAKRYALPRQRRLQQRLSELQTVSDQYHRFDSNNGQVEVPPRYSDLYPRINSLDRTSTQSGRISTTGSVGSRSLSSFTRNSASRMSMRRVRNSETLPREQSNESDANQTKEPLPKHPDIIVESDQTNEPVITSNTVNLNMDTANQPTVDEENTHL